VISGGVRPEEGGKLKGEIGENKGAGAGPRNARGKTQPKELAEVVG